MRPHRVISSPALPIHGRRAIEDYLARLNLASPVAERRILSWGPAGEDGLGLSTQPLAPTDVEEGASLAECQVGFALELRTRCRDAAPRGPVVGLLLAGSMTISVNGDEVVVPEGEGVIIDPAAVDRSLLEPGTRFVEFTLPRAPMQRLCQDWAPGFADHLPRFAPKIAPPLAQKLAFMVAHWACALQAIPQAGVVAPTMAADLARRWTEMIGLTLLNEQRIDNMLTPPRWPGLHGPTPASVRRAIEFMQANANTAIGLADIAEAACSSARSVLRHFQTYVGMSPAAYLRGIRLERARQDVRAGRDNIRDIALRWGFQNASKFSRAYHRQFGEVPSKHRAVR